MSTRHGKLADGKTTLSVVLDESLKNDLQKLADLSERQLSDYVRRSLTAIARQAKSLNAADEAAQAAAENHGARRLKGK